jgi:penicillin amidase
VNAHIELGRPPIEFTLLSHVPEPWTVADTLSWAKMMSWDLSVNWEAELLRAQMIELLGPERAAELEPEYPGRCPLVVPAGVDCLAEHGTALDRAEASRPYAGPGPGSGLGSNSWAVSGSRTVSGQPLLANDMHLAMTLPSIWYENHLRADGFHVTGITFPGIPGIVVGHNGRVAWGFTNGFPDVQDLYQERLRRADDGRVEYEFQGEWLEAQVVREEIHVKGSESVLEEVIVTRHGPIVNSLALDIAGEEPLAMRWVSLDPDTTIEVLFEMPQVRNCDEFRDALRMWAAPSQNAVYADVEGNIGYSLTGKVPVRAKGDGRVPVPGWTGEYEWTGYIPFEEMPHVSNPEEGYLATANNRVHDETYPHYLGYDHCTGDRAQRIVELIEGAETIDRAACGRMQADQESTAARVIAAFVGELEVDGELRPVVRLMRDWDACLGPDSAAAAVYQVFARRMVLLLLGPKLGGLSERYAGKGPTPVLREGSIFSHRAWEWLEKTLADPESEWFDLGRRETRAEVMTRALRETVEYLTEACGPDIEDWAWGKLHKLTFGHLLGRQPLLAPVFNRGPFAIGGDDHTLWATGASTAELDNESLIGPPYRFIVDLGDLSKSVSVLVPGQSGQPGSRHYDDQVQSWFDGEYHPMLFEWEDVEDSAETRLWLEPDPQH